MAKNKVTEQILNRKTKHSDIFLAIGMVFVLVVLLIPMHTFIMDIMLTFAFGFSFAILMITIYNEKPVNFSVFPSMLLFITLFRLSLNVATTRLILLQADAGKVVQAFGQFVVGGNYVVGIIIFLILVAINFMVITKGSGRISEVAARFTLDSMPGKQMAIDADLNNGLITEEEALEKREEIRKEADFFGSMDGAAKFVRGDVSAGLMITAINIIGGIVVGVVQLKMPFVKALQTYTILTIGDGLVSQIPALIISTTAGLLVTKVSSDTNVAQDLAKQIMAQPKALYICSVMLGVFGILPGLPTIPFLLLSGIFGFLGYNITSIFKKATAEEEEQKMQVEKEKPRKPEKVEKFLEVDPMELEIGYALIPLVDTGQGGDLLERIAMIRRQCATDMGIIVPPIRIRDNMQLEPNEYVIKVKGIIISKNELMPGYYLAMSPGLKQEKGKVEGIETQEPAFGLPALWVSDMQKERAEVAGYTVVDNSSVLSTHLTEIIKQYSADILGKQDVQNIIDNIKENYPAVVDDLIPSQISIGVLHRVLQSLLKERVPIRDIVSILEALSDVAQSTKDIDMLSEHVRQQLKRSICDQYKNENNEISVITLDPKLEQQLMESVQYVDRKSNIIIEPALAQFLINGLKVEVQKINNQNLQPVLLCLANIRLPLRRLVERFLPGLVFLSYNEILPEIAIKNQGMVVVQNDYETV